MLYTSITLVTINVFIKTTTDLTDLRVQKCTVFLGLSCHHSKLNFFHGSKFSKTPQWRCHLYRDMGEGLCIAVADKGLLRRHGGINP